MTNKKIQSIQALRGAAVLLVLARHILVMEEHFGGGKRLLPEVVKVGDGGVDIFFVISGFIMVVVSSGRFQTPGEIGSFLYRRIIRIYPLYWIYTLAIITVFLIVPAYVPAMQKREVDLLASFLLLPQFGVPLLGQGWTLVYETYFYGVFALALLLPERRLARFLLVWGLVAAVGWNIYSAWPGFFRSPTIKMIADPLAVEFVFGACVALAIRRGWRRGDWLCLASGCALLPVSSIFFDPLDFDGLRVFCFGIPAVLILYGAVSLERRSRLQFPQWLQALGDVSYSTYLSHILVITAVGRIWSAVRQPGLWDHALAILIMAAAAVGWGFVSFRFIERPMLRAMRTWRPRRKSVPNSSSLSIVSE